MLSAGARGLAHGVTGREAVESGFFGSVGLQPYHRITPEIERQTAAILALLEIPHLAERTVTEMSSGEARRVLLARAQIGIILVTHHLADIIPEIDRVILMREGRIVADGRKPDVLSAAALSGLFGLRVDLRQRDGYYHLW